MWSKNLRTTKIKIEKRIKNDRIKSIDSIKINDIIIKEEQWLEIPEVLPLQMNSEWEENVGNKDVGSFLPHLDPHFTSI